MSSPNNRRAEVDVLELYELSRQGKPVNAISKIINVSESTLRRKYKNVYNRGHDAFRNQQLIEKQKEKEENPTPIGRPPAPIEVDLNLLAYEMGFNGTSKKCCYSVMGIGDERFESEFAEDFEKGYQAGNHFIWAQQIRMLKEGDRTMAIWLGKQRLNQKETVIPDNEKPTGFKFNK